MRVFVQALAKRSPSAPIATNNPSKYKTECGKTSRGMMDDDLAYLRLQGCGLSPQIVADCGGGSQGHHPALALSCWRANCAACLLVRRNRSIIAKSLALGLETPSSQLRTVW